jgi:hypothetical protein
VKPSPSSPPSGEHDRCPAVLAAPSASVVATVAVAPPAASSVTPPPIAPPASASVKRAPPPPPGIFVAAKGGPKGTRPCEFHESVDTYPRQCTISTFDDGSLLVTAKGTKLNPDNGFQFRMGGGPGSFAIAGGLDAFSICKGPFVGTMQAIEDHGRTIYEARLGEHCMIVIR